MRRAALTAQARIEMLLTVRRPESLLVTLGIPLGVLVFFAEFDGVSSVKDPVEFLVPGILSLAVMSTAMVSLGIATGYERRYGVLKRLGSTPLSRSGLLTAKTMNVLAIEVVQAVLIVAVGIVLGWKVTAGILPAIVILLIGTVAFAGIGMLLAGTLRAEANLAVANGLYLVLLFLGGMAYPLARLPDAIRFVAELLPAAALSQSVRGVLQDSPSVPLGSFAVLVVWAVAAPLLAVRYFRWEE
ncbi:MAG: ABC transporter permease [Acidimicrobiia bacterium]